MTWKAHFSKALGRGDAPLHFAAHSHHPWPDISYDAHSACWLDAAQWLDRKWEKAVAPRRAVLQKKIAEVLNLPDPATLTFATNTHEFLLRILSCFPPRRAVRILATDGEFHSFRRQIARLEEDDLVDVERIPVEPFATFADRFCAAAARGGHDLVWTSQAFFNSGFVVPDLARIATAVASDETFMVIDGYHGFLAVETDLSAVAGRAFYLAGGYKYAMSGEGCCFLHCPPGYGARPRDTGWYAAFAALAQTNQGVTPYAEDAGRFDGATYDASGIYRMAAVLEWMEREGLTVARAVEHCRGLQIDFLKGLEKTPGRLAAARLLLDPRRDPCGRFLTFVTDDAADIYAALEGRNVIVDHRADRLRIGFGVYHDEADVSALIKHLNEIGRAV